MAILTYLFKYRPYMTVWVVCSVFTGIKEHDFSVVVACILLAAVPAMIKKGLWTLNQLTTLWNSLDERRFGSAPRGRFTEYFEEYMKR